MSAAHDTGLEVGGDLYWVRRDFDLMRRIEQAFGPLSELDAKLRAARLIGDDLVKLLAIVLKAQVSRPTIDELAQHVMDEGVREVSNQIAILVMHLFAGNKRAIAWLEAEAKAKAAEAAPENPQQAA